MTAPDRETPSTSWAVWAWQAYRDGRLVEASETHTPLAEAVLALHRYMVSTPYGDQEALLLSDVLRAIGEPRNG